MASALLWGVSGLVLVAGCVFALALCRAAAAADHFARGVPAPSAKRQYRPPRLVTLGPLTAQTSAP